MKRLRTLSAIAAVPLVLVGLAACSGSGSAKATASATSTPSAITSCPSDGAVSKSVKVSGGEVSKTAPKVTFKQGLSASTPQLTIDKKSGGKKLKSGDYVDVAYTVYRASTGKNLTTVGYGQTDSTDTAAPQALSVGGSGLAEVLACGVRVGDQIVVVGDGTRLGFTVSYQLVVVADIVKDIPTHSTGAAQPQSSSLPTVKDSSDGEPTITIPKNLAAPTKTEVEVIKQGTGATVAENDSVLVQYKGVVFSTGKEFDSTWSRGEPTTFTVAQGQLITGFVTGLVGQKVGSQVLIAIPAADAYGANPPEGSGIPKNAALVFVVDILSK